MRRGLASMLMGLSLLVASMGWAGFIVARAVLDEDRSDELAARLLQHEGVSTVIAGRLGDGMERHVPDDEPMSRQELNAAAAEAITDPLAASALSDALSNAYRLGLADIAADPTFDHFDVNEAARHALLAARPSLEGRILVNPLVRVQLPVDGLTWLSGLKTMADRFAVVALAAAMIGFATSFIAADEPTAVLRRAASWILGSATVWAVLGPLFAALVRFAVPSSFVVLAVTVETALVSMQRPAIVMGAFGVGMASVGYLAPAVGRRRGALLIERARRRLRADPDSATPTTASVAATRSVTGPDSRRSTSAGQARDAGMGSRLSAAWKEGHGYLDDARVAPFFSGPPRDR